MRASLLVAFFAALLTRGAYGQGAGITADHHQHLFRNGLPGAQDGSVPFGATELTELLDVAGISSAVVLSLGYQLGNPNRPALDDEYEQVKAENDWTSREVARYPTRLTGFCGFNPLKEYALAELERCAGDPNLRRGIKLHFGNSDVQLDNPQQVEQLRQVFRAADRAGMAIVIHMRSSVSMRRPYGATQARVFLDELIPAAPNITIQIAHLAGAGGYDDPAIDEAVAVFAEAVRRRDPRMAHVFFDVSGIAGIGDWHAKAELVVRRIRELGIERVLYGSDGAVSGNRPGEARAAFMQLPLSEAERAAIIGNVAPYLRDGDGAPASSRPSH